MLSPEPDCGRHGGRYKPGHRVRGRPCNHTLTCRRLRMANAQRSPFIATVQWAEETMSTRRSTNYQCNETFAAYLQPEMPDGEVLGSDTKLAHPLWSRGFLTELSTLLAG